MELRAKTKSRITASGAIRGQVERARRGRVVGGVPPDGFDHMVVDRQGREIERHRYIRPGPRGQRNASVWHILTPDGKFVREIVGPPPKQKTCEITLVPGAPERVEAVRMIFEMFGREGKGYKQISHTLNRKRIPSPRGNVWTVGAVRAILMNPAYEGKAAFNQRTSAKVYRIANRPDAMGNDHTKIEQEDSERARTRWNAREDWIVVEDAFQSPVPRELAKKARERLALMQGACTACAPGSVIPRESRSSGLLAGFIVCAKCGRYYRTHTWTWTSTDPRTRKTTRKKNYNYVCARYEDGGAEACARLYVKREVLEAPVVDSVVALIEDFRKHFEGAGRERQKRILRSFEKGITVDPDRREVTIDFYRVPPLPGGAPELAEGWYPHGDLNPGLETENLASWAARRWGHPAVNITNKA